MEGTYPLPEAQLDRFFVKLKVDYPTIDSMHTIMNRTTKIKEPEVNRVLGQGEVLEMRKDRARRSDREARSGLRDSDHAGDASAAPLCPAAYHESMSAMVQAAAVPRLW